MVRGTDRWSSETVRGALAGGQITGYQIDAALQYPDIGDAHLHAAAVHGAVDIIVTRNGKDLPYSDDLPYEIYEPDDFLVLVDDAAPHAVQAVTELQLRYFHQKCSSDEGVDLPYRLKKAGAPEFATRVRDHAARLHEDPDDARTYGEFRRRCCSFWLITPRDAELALHTEYRWRVLRGCPGAAFGAVMFEKFEVDTANVHCGHRQ